MARTPNYLLLLLTLTMSSCVYYPSLDYIRYEGVDYGYFQGSEHKIYYKEYGRQTSISDKIFQFGIGQKKFREFNSDPDLASKTITKQVFEKEGYCPEGYKISYEKGVYGGDLSFIWKVFCN